jgi:putative ABC transport system permease protein
VPALGVYYDYGNPNPQWLASAALWQECWPGLPPAGQAIIGPDELNWAALTAAMSDELGWQEGDWIDQQALRAVGMAVFDQTFTVTRALNLLTLLVAGIGIFCAVSAIHHHRLGQQAVLATLGLSRRERGALLLLQWGVLGLFSMVLVWPFGALLAGYLAAVVTPVAFGWSFPLVLNVPHYLTLALTGTAGLLLAVLWPSLRLMRITPATQLRRISV